MTRLSWTQSWVRSMKSRAFETRENYLRDLMYSAQRKLGIRTQKRMAEEMGMTEGTYKDRLQNPGGMRMNELWSLAAVCRHAGMEIEPGKIVGVRM